MASVRSERAEYIEKKQITQDKDLKLAELAKEREVYVPDIMLDTENNFLNRRTSPN